MKTIFNCDNLAYEYISTRFWRGGHPICPRCRSGISRIGTYRDAKVSSRRRNCKYCKKPYSLITGTFMEGSRLPLSSWLLFLHFWLDQDMRVTTRSTRLFLGCTHHTGWRLSRRMKNLKKEDTIRLKRLFNVEFF